MNRVNIGNFLQKKEKVDYVDDYDFSGGGVRLQDGSGTKVEMFDLTMLAGRGGGGAEGSGASPSPSLKMRVYPGDLPWWQEYDLEGEEVQYFRFDNIEAKKKKQPPDVKAVTSLRTSGTTCNSLPRYNLCIITEKTEKW